VDVDTQQLECVFTYNAFSLQVGPPDMLDLSDSTTHAQSTGAVDHPRALYLLPSLINHSCTGTVSRHNFGDVMVARAATDLNEGEELTWPYATQNTYLTRQSALKQYMISCDCWLCHADRKDGDSACRQRETLLSKFTTSLVSRNTSMPKVAQAFLGDVEATYAATRGPVRPASAKAHHALAIGLVFNMKKDSSSLVDSIRENMAALEALGVSVIDKSIIGHPQASSLPISKKYDVMVGQEHRVKYALVISTGFWTMKDSVRAERWLRAAFWLSEVSIGGGSEVFYMRCDRILRQIGLKDFARAVKL